MTPQNGESPTMFAMPTVTAAQARPEHAAAYAMRPLSTGEVLDRTFAIYRSRFWLFAGISALSGAVQVIASSFNLLGQHMVMTKYGFATASLESGIGSSVGALLFLLASAVTQAATVYALSEVYLGRSITISGALQPTIRFWYRYLGIGLWQAWSAMWLLMLVLTLGVLFFVPRFGFHSLMWLGGGLIFLAVFGGGAYGAIAYLRNSLAVQASVVERNKVRASMRRSKTLTPGAKGRIFVVLLITVALYWVGGAIQMPMAFFIIRSPLQPHVAAQAVMLAISFLTHTLVSPVALIGLSLVYFDQRVRKEAFDLVMLMGEEMPASVAVSETTFAAPLVNLNAASAAGDAASVAVPFPAEESYGAEANEEAADPIGDDGRD